MQEKDLIADVLPPPEYIIESYLVGHQLMDADDPAQRAALTERLTALQKDHQTRYAFWRKEGLDPDLADVLLKQATGRELLRDCLQCVHSRARTQ